jgi:hypothetical protein
MVWNKHLLLFALLIAGVARAADSAEQERINTAVAALTRMENVNLDVKPSIKAAVERVLEKTRGTPNFTRLVKHFKLTNQNPALIEVAVRNSTNDAGVEAIRLVLASDDLPALRNALETTNATEQAQLVEVLGHAKDRRTVSLLEPLVMD